MLNPKYNYVCFDLETTGLNKEEDEIIQIAIVKFTSGGAIEKKFSTLVKTEGTTIKDFITYLTGIDNEDIQSAPKFSEIHSDVMSFFDEKTIIVGHNIQFDIDFLKKYIPDLRYKDYIDTYHLAKHFVHFPPSYALEVLVEILYEKKKQFRCIQDELLSTGEAGKHHDAMTDTLNSWSLFRYCITKINSILDTYPAVINLFNKIEGLWSDLIVLPTDWKGKIIGNISLPVLEHSVPDEKRLLSKEGIPIDTLADKSSYYVGNTDMKTLLFKLASNKNIILCFDSLHKLNRAKQILNEIGITPGALYDQQIIDKKKFITFLNKKEFSVDELFFVLKYLSTKMDGFSIIQTNTPIDYKIMYYIKKKDEFSKSPILLATHTALFSNKDNEKLQGYRIIFFDSDWWYKNYNYWISRNIDGYGLVYFMETLLYTYSIKKDPELVHEIQLMYDKVLMFVGVLSLECQHFLEKNNTQRAKEVNPLITNPDFTKTAALRGEIEQMQELMLGNLDDESLVNLQQKFQEVHHILHTVVNITKRMNYNATAQHDAYYVLSEHTQYTDWSEFIELFAQYHTIFLSHNNKSYTRLVDDEKSRSLDTFSREKNIDTIISDVSERYAGREDGCAIFILSTKKFESQAIFNILISQSTLSDWDILGENITGGAGKNIYKAKKSSKTILIGGYQFLLHLYAMSIFPDHIYIHNMYGPTEKLILNDIIWYGEQRKSSQSST